MEQIQGKLKRVMRKLDNKRMKAGLMTAVLVASQMLSAISPIATQAYAADEPEQKAATVTLMDTEHGKLAFKDTDERTIASNVGDSVTVKVIPDDGYFADSVSVFDEKGNAEAVDVKNNEATFTVEKNAMVSSTFYENGSAGSKPLKAVEVKEQNAVTSVEEYVKKHMDSKYVGKGDTLTREDILTVTTSIVDGKQLSNATLDTLWSDADGDGVAENWKALINQSNFNIILFEANKNANYYVGWAGADIKGAKLTDWGAAENNADAVLRQGFVVDKETGLVYVPKSYTKTNDEGKRVVDSSRIQLLYTVQNDGATVNFDFDSDLKGVSGNIANEGKTTAPVTAANTVIKLADDDTARKALDGNAIDSVTVNGFEYKSNMGMYNYDAETGELTVNTPPSAIHAMKVKASNNVAKRFTRLFAAPAATPQSINNIGTWEVENSLQKGFAFSVKGKNLWHQDGSWPNIAPGILPAQPKNSVYKEQLIRQALGYIDVDISTLTTAKKTSQYLITRATTIYGQTRSGVTIPSDVTVALYCADIKVGVFPDEYDKPFGIKDEDWAYAVNSESPQRINIISVSGNKAIVGITSPTVYGQAGAGFFEINWKLKYNPGKLTLKKTSANPSLTNGNDCYSLAGAQFTVYDKAGQNVGTLVTDASGNSNTLTNLVEGTYTVKETKAPKGYYPAPDKTVTVKSGETATVSFADTPAGDPVHVLIGKFDGFKTYNGKKNLPQGSASLAGAEFTIEYYDTLSYNSYADLKKANVKPTRTWVVQTNENGFADLTTKISGDDFYYDTHNDITVPRGSIAIYESKAPEGYLLNKQDVNFQKIQENPTQNIVTYNMPQVPEKVIRGGVELYKRDIESGLATGMGGASMEGTTFAIKSLNNNDVVVNGKTYKKDAVVTTITVKDGKAATDAHALPYGSYSLEETDTGEGYKPSDKVYKFDIREDGKLVHVTDNGVVNNQVIRGDFEFNKKADNSGDKLALIPFKVTSQTTGESHVIVTDENGYFNSSASWNKHSVRTNGNDWAMDETGRIDSSKLDAKAGVWFGKTTDNKTVAVNDALGALPYDTYTIEELPATNNKGYSLIYTSIVVSRNGIVYNFGTLDDKEVTLSTHAFDPVDMDGHVSVGEVSIHDKVIYSGLLRNNEYKLKATLHDSETGDAILVDGNPVVVEKTFTAKSGSGSVVVEIDVPTYDLGGKTVTIYEELYDLKGGKSLVLADHSDKDDKDQQITIDEVKIGTTATDNADSDKNLTIDDEVTIKDTVTYSNLIPGKEYTVKGTLHKKVVDKDGKVTDEVFKVDGKAVTAEKTFTPKTANGMVDILFTFNALGLSEGEQIVAFEKMEQKGHELAVHADINDENQTVKFHYPKIGTLASDKLDGDKLVVADTEASITDKVSFEGIRPDGKTVYTMAGIVMDANTGLPLLTKEGKEKYSEDDLKKFVSDMLSVFGFGKDSANNPDMLDWTATATMPVKTVDMDAVKKFTNEHKDLLANLVYNIKTFTPDGENGTESVDLGFNAFDVMDSADKTKNLVVFEMLFKGDIAKTDTPITIVAVHADINDEGQTVTIIPSSIGTTATDNLDGDKTAVRDDVVTIKDTVTYQNLIPGKEYTVTGVLHKKVTDENGKVTDEVFKVNGKAVTAEKTFTPDKANGTVDMLFTFNALELEKTTELVAFESVKKGDVEVAVHADINDEGQTVTIIPSSIGTTATDKSDGDHEIVAGGNTTIVDTVAFKNLIPGKEYKLKATLYDKATGKAVQVDGKTVTAELRFTPNEPNGSIDIELNFDSSKLGGHDVVVFEELYKQSQTIDGKIGDVLVAEHSDLNDEGQTVRITTPPSDTPEKPSGSRYGKTGDNGNAIAAAICVLLLLASGAAAYGVRSKVKESGADTPVSEDSKE